MGMASPMPRCLSEDEIALVLTEVHEGVYESHISGQALDQKLLRGDYYLPNLIKDIANCAKK